MIKWPKVSGRNNYSIVPTNVKKISDFSVKRIHQKSLMYIYYNFYSLNDFTFFSVLELFSVFKQAQVFTKENERQYNKDTISIMLFHSFMRGKLKTVKLAVDVFIVSSSSLLHLSLCNLLRCNLTSVCRYCSLSLYHKTQINQLLINVVVEPSKKKNEEANSPVG